METKNRIGPRSMSLCKTGLKGPCAMMFEVLLQPTFFFLTFICGIIKIGKIGLKKKQQQIYFGE